MRAELTTPAWESLTLPDSGLYKLLTSDIFKNQKKGQAEDQIDSEILLIAGLLGCAATPNEKAVALYGILQEGGIEAHEIISATDKDLEPVFEKMCELSAWGIFAFTA